MYLRNYYVLLCPEKITIVWPIFSGFDVNSFLLKVVLIPKLILIFPANLLNPGGATPDTTKNTITHTSERSSVPGASSSSSLVDTRLCKIYNEYEICKMQYAKGGSCQTGWVWINVLLIGKTPSPDPGSAIRCASRVGLGIFLLSMVATVDSICPHRA